MDDMQAQPGIHPQYPNPDERTMARAVLAWCADGPDALMQAVVQGTHDPRSVLESLKSLRGLSTEDIHSNSQDQLDALDDAFKIGVEDWGGEVNDTAMRAFRRSLVRWSTRLNDFPDEDPRLILTAQGTQWIIGPEHPLWPTRINDLSERRDWTTPLCLWGQGDPTSLVICDNPIAVVGSRGCDDYGRDGASDIAHNLSYAGHTVISGGAMGTDAAAHWGVIRAWNNPSSSTPPGRTVAIFAGGLDRAGPQCNLRLFRAILDHHGALVSELAPGTIPVARRFLLRNRLIAGLSSSVVVAQARIRSGALNTAGWANELGRSVYAIPGRIDSPRNAGCHQLIRESQAILLHSVTDIDGLVPDEHTHDDHARGNPSPNSPPVRADSTMLDSTGIRKTDNHLKGPRNRSDKRTRGNGSSHDVSTQNLPGHESAMAVLTEIRSCAHDHVPATVDEIERRLNRQKPSPTMSLGDILAAVSSLEMSGMVEVRSGALIASTGSHADPHASEPLRPNPHHRLF